MGFFDKILSGLGFESEDKTHGNEDKKDIKPKDKTNSSPKGKYVLKETENNYFFEPEDFTELKSVLKLARNKKITISLANFYGENFIACKSFIEGYVFAMGKNLEQIEEAIFKIC